MFQTGSVAKANRVIDALARTNRHHPATSGTRDLKPETAGSASHAKVCLHDIGSAAGPRRRKLSRSEEHTSELQSLMRLSYAVFCLKTKNKHDTPYLTALTII